MMSVVERERESIGRLCLTLAARGMISGTPLSAGDVEVPFS